MKLLTRTAFVFLTALALVAAACAGSHSDTDVTYAVTGGNIYFNKSSGTVTDCDEDVTEAVIPAQIDGVAVTSIGNSAFDGCSGLTSVEIPNSVTSIRAYAFESCRGLTSVEIPNSVTSIGQGAFSYCRGLTSVEIPDSVASIGDNAFSYCRGLTSVEIPNSVTSIGDGAFYKCSGLTNIHVASGNQQYVSIDGVLFDKSQTTLICYPAGKTGAYQIPNSVTSIGRSAFSDCSGLTSVEIPNSVTSIENYAFWGCSGLTNVEIPNSVTSIGRSAFSDCSGLTSVEIPNAVTSIGESAFWGCSGLTSVKIPDGVTAIEYGAFYACSNLTSVEIPNSVTSIGQQAFDNCSGLTSVEIPSSVTSIGNYSFYGCDSLRDVYYGGSREQWEAINGINNSRLISDKITIHYNASMPSAPEFTIPSAPTVNGRAISAADLSGLTEISVPLTISGETAVSVTICVPFFDGGKFLGMGFVTATVDNNTSFVTVPVTGDVSGAEKLKVIFVDADFRPLSVTGFDIAA